MATAAPPETSPFDVKSIFKEILDYVATDHRSLLACRLVSHPWNELALDVLCEKEARMNFCKSSPTLPVATTSTKAKKGVKGLPGPGRSQSLDFKQVLNSLLKKGKEAKLKSSLNSLDLCFPCDTSCVDPEYPLNQVVREITRGHNLTVSTIIFESSGNYDTQLSNLKFFLFSCSSTLKYFSYTQKYTALCPENPWPDDKFEDISFPNLSRIRIVCKAKQYLNPVLMDVINSSPKLRAVELGYGSSDTLAWHPTSTLLSTFRTRLSPETRSRLEELTVPTLHWRRFEPTFFSGFNLANLRKLQLHLETQMLKFAVNQEHFNNFLRNGVPRLKSLHLVWAPEPRPTDFGDFEAELRFSPQFPSLPELEQFGTSNLQDVSQKSNLFINQFLRSIAHSCTAINTFSIDVCSLCELISRNIGHQQQDDKRNKKNHRPWYNDIVFPQVQNLILTVNFVLGMDKADSVQGASARIPLVVNAMFPNLKKLTLTGEVATRTLKLTENYIFPAILEVAGITSLEICPYYTNYLSKQVIQMYKLAKCLEVLVLKSANSPDQSTKAEPFRVLELTQLLKNFRRLKVLEISSKLLLDQDGGTDFNKIFKGKRLLRGSFSAVDIKII